MLSITDGGERKLLKRVTNDGSPKFNTIIVYEEGDEIYEHWDAMYCWEEPEEPKVKRSSLMDFIAPFPPPKLTYSRGILFDEMKRDYKRKEEEKLFGIKPINPKMKMRNLSRIPEDIWKED